MTETTASSSSERKDPIRTNYFTQLEAAESASGWLFYFAALMSFAPTLIEKRAHPTLYSVLLICFVVAVVTIFVIGIATRLYLFPRAEAARRKDFVSNTFGFDLIRERTAGYYNNAETEPLKRMGLSLLENIYFTKTILQKMAPGARAKALLYFLLWICVALWRDTPLDVVATAAQVLFSEEIVARALRLEWARMKAEELYETMHRLFQSRPAADRLAAYSIDAFVEYESCKSVSAILQPSQLFDRLNPKLTAEWEEIKKSLGLK